MQGNQRALDSPTYIHGAFEDLATWAVILHMSGIYIIMSSRFSENKPGTSYAANSLHGYSNYDFLWLTKHHIVFLSHYWAILSPPCRHACCLSNKLKAHTVSKWGWWTVMADSSLAENVQVEKKKHIHLLIVATGFCSAWGEFLRRLITASKPSISATSWTTCLGNRQKQSYCMCTNDGGMWIKTDVSGEWSRAEGGGVWRWKGRKDQPMHQPWLNSRVMQTFFFSEWIFYF